MLASATDHLCRTQSYHFPGIVADISMESLCSPSADEKYYSAISKKSHPHRTLSSDITATAIVNDINRNISNEQVLKSLVTKEANANCDQSHETKSDNRNHITQEVTSFVNSCKETHKSDTLLTENNEEEYVETATSDHTENVTDNGNFDKKCLSDGILKSCDGLGKNKFMKPLSADEVIKLKSATHILPSETKAMDLCHRASQNVDRDSPKSNNNPIACEKKKTNHRFPEERSSISTHPFVNIRTLGDGSDGAYEISIQNLYPTNVYHVESPNLEEDIETNVTNHDAEGSHRKELKDTGHRSNTSSGSNYHSGHLVEEEEWEDKKFDNNTAENNLDCGIRQRPSSLSLSDDQGKHLNKDLVLKLQRLLKPCATNNATEHDVKGSECHAKREYLLMPSCSDEVSNTKPHDSSFCKENGISRTPPIETYDVHRRRKRRPRKLPEIPKQSQKGTMVVSSIDKLQQQDDYRTHQCKSQSWGKDVHLTEKDLNVSLPIKLSHQVQAPPNGTVLSLADELRIATLANNDENQSEESASQNNSKPEYLSESYRPTVPSPPLNIGTNLEQLMSKSQTLRHSSGVNSILSLKELGSPEDIEPPSFRDSGFFQDIEYDDDIIKQQMQIEQQQQLLLRTLYKDRHVKIYANDCDSGYNTQDPEGQSRPGSTGPNLCCKCGSQVAVVDDMVPKKLINSEVAASMVNSTQSITDCYIDDVPKADEPPKREITLEYTGQMCREPPDGGNADKSPEETDEGSKSTEVKLLNPLTTEDEAPGNNQLPGVSETELMYLDVTHRCCHKFVPRHSDELFIEIGDPIYVCKEDDDLWCEGVNLRTKKKGIFPSVCATDLNFLEGEGDGKCQPVRFYLRFLGSVQVKYAKGTQVLTQAIQKVVMSRRMTLNSNPPPMSCLEINDYGIKLSEKTTRKVSSSSRMPRSLSQILGRGSKSATESDENSHFYSLKNVTYCGYHPTNQKYFAFITKHPLEMKFACHVMLAEESSRCISDAVSAVFKKYYQKYLAETHPTEDIYMED